MPAVVETPSSYLVILRRNANSWSVVEASIPFQELPPEITLDPANLLDGGVFPRTVLTAALGTQLASALNATHYSCMRLPTPDETFLLFDSPQPRRVFSKYPPQPPLAFQLAVSQRIFQRRAAILTEVTQLFTEAQNNDDPAVLLQRVIDLGPCSATSLWLYNKYTSVFTLAAVQGVDRALYDRDWLHEDEPSYINTLLQRDQDIMPVSLKRPHQRTLNPKVADRFDSLYLCRLRSPDSGRPLAVLTLYDVKDQRVLPPSFIAATLASALRSYLMRIRAARRRLGVEIALTALRHSAGDTLPEALDRLCISIVERLLVGGCSVFLARDEKASSVYLMSTSDTRYPEFVGKQPGRWWTSISYSADQGLTGKVFATNKTRAIYEVANDPLNTHTYDEIVRGPRKGWLGVPIPHPLNPNKAVGVIRAVNKQSRSDASDTPIHFTGSDVETLEHLAVIIGYLWHSAQLQQASEDNLATAQKATAAKTDFLRALTHEIIAPLGPLMNVLELLSREPRLRTSAIKKLPYLLQSATHQCAQMQYMVTNVASLNIPTPTVHPTFVKVVTEIVQPMLDIFRVHARVDKNVDFFFANELWDLPPVFFDAGIARQIMFVLLHNAFKYSDENTTIEIAGDYNPSRNMVFLHVQDTGLEIPEGWQDRIFEIGERAPNICEQLLPGSGIGLHVARRFAQSLHGNVFVSCSADPVVMTIQFPINPED